jgi:hypothetical protein
VLSEKIAQQLGNPFNLVRRLVPGPLWNKRNSALNDVVCAALSHLLVHEGAPLRRMATCREDE